MTNQNPTDNRAELEAALRELITYADLMPKKTPAAGSCVTEHQFTITAGAIWGLDERVQKAKSVLAALSSPPSDQERGLDEAALLPEIAEMMSAHVENWPNPKRVKTAISLIDKTLAAAISENRRLLDLLENPPPTVEHAAPQAEVESLWPADWPFAERLAEFLSRGPYEQETIQRNKSASIVMLSYNDLLADAKELLAALQSSQPPTSLDGDQERGLEHDARQSTLVARLKQYEGKDWETTFCYNGLRDEAAIEIERLTAANTSLAGVIDRLTGELERLRNVEHAAPQAVAERVAEALAKFADTHMISPGSAVLWADRTPANREYFTKAALTAIAALSPSSSTEEKIGYSDLSVENGQPYAILKIGFSR